MKALNQLTNKDWDWNLLWSILAYQSIPLVYNSYAVYLIGNAIPSANSLPIVSQWQFVQVGAEVLQESLVLPIFFYVGSKLKSNNHSLLEERIASAIRIIIFALFPVALFLFFWTDSFVNFIGTPSEIASATVSYLKIKVWAILFGIINLGLVVIIQSLKEKHLLIKVLLYKLVFSVILDSLFYGGYSYSLNLGTTGVAISNLLVEASLTILTPTVLMKSLGINPLKSFTNFRKIDFKEFRSVSLGIFVESAIKNAAYFTMIITLINSLGAKQIGGYYLTMHIFWGFLLLPILALSDTLKVQIANYYSDIAKVKSLLKTGAVVGGAILALWIIAMPFSNRIFNQFNSDATLVEYAELSFTVLFLPYMIMAMNMLIDSVFYGLGRTKYLALQSIFTNVLVYVTAFILYKLNIWNPTFNSILALFSLGILVDTIFTVIYLNRILKITART